MYRKRSGVHPNNSSRKRNKCEESIKEDQENSASEYKDDIEDIYNIQSKNKIESPARKKKAIQGQSGSKSMKIPNSDSDASLSEKGIDFIHFRRIL